MNKAEIMTKKHDKKCPLAPRLRFPEFRNAGEWEKMALHNICTILSGYTFPEFLQGKQYGQYPFCKVSDISKAVSSDGGLLHSAANYIDADEISALKLKLIPIGTTLFAKIGEALRLNRRAISTVECLIDNNIVGIKTNSEKSIDYFIYLLSQLIDLNEYCGGAVPAVNKAVLENIPVVIPTCSEQQRIADCLSSLDERITAETSKLERLKEHKKGLLKQLFPAEGEKLPQLRFPEFRDDMEWSKKKVHQIAKIYRGRGISKLDISSDGEQLCIRYGELYTSYGEVIHEVISKTSLPADNLFLSKVNDVIIPSSGETKIDIATASCVMKDDVALGGDLNVIRSCQNGIFISYYFNGNLKEEIAKKAQGDTVVHLYPSQIDQLSISIPSKDEQQRIADCLSSLDELITAQTKKIDLLKEHKKGLMQQLFPRIDEVLG